MQGNCPKCKAPISESFFFCPNCGRKLKNPPPDTHIGKQIGIYALSILLPPLGLVPGIRYVISKETKARIIGLVAILLTLASSYVTYQVTVNFINQFQNNIQTQLQSSLQNQIQTSLQNQIQQGKPR